MSFTIAATGDAMLLKGYPDDYNFSDLVIELKKANIKFSNLEMVTGTKDIYASTFCGGQWLFSEKKNVDQLMKFEFDALACANNHSMDFSVEGIKETCTYLKEKRIPFAGIGLSLKEASNPTYINVKDSNGKNKCVAMISMTTTFIDAARAGDSNEFFASRPGLNPLRHKELYYVSNKQMKVLKEIAASTYINGERDNARKIGSLPPEKEGTFNFGGIFFKESNDAKGKLTECDKRDSTRIHNEIINAKNKADYVVIMAHSHQIKRGEYTEPDYFFEEFCRGCIDAGASCVFGGGTHQLKPIEVYKGKPIFYSLGNFIYETQLVDKLPDDFWDKYDYSRKLSVAEGMAIKTKNWTIGLELDRYNYLSLIPYLTFENNNLINIRMLPIELNFESSRFKGLPRIANIQDSKFIMSYLNDICKEIQFTLENEENTPYITVKSII